jgi:lysophosphatidylcholine acyltransferase / lyso-PAF acetyltransferase
MMNLLAICYLVYAVLIVGYFKNLMQSLKFTEKLDPHLPEKFKPFERHDRANWRMWEIYAGALVLLPLRVVLTILLYSVACSSTFIFGLGVGDHWPKGRYAIIKWIVSSLTRIKLFICGFYYIEIKRIPLTDHLPKEEVVFEPTTIIVSNHVSWWDSFVILSYCFPSFLAKDEVRRLPLIGYFASKFNSIFVKRASKDDRDSVLDQIQNRCRLIESGKTVSPVVIFPEATTTNGRYLLDFKKGAFDQGFPVKLIALKYSDRHFNLALDNIGMAGTLIPYMKVC